MNLNEIIKERRSYYAIDKNVNVTDERMKEIIKDAVKYSPSAFNSQGSYAVLLLGKHHTKLWDIVMSTLRKIVPAENFAPTEKKINSFEAGYATVLFFEDTEVIKNLQGSFPQFKDNFPTWGQHSNSILQYIIWTTLEAEGLGASLQHYNPLIDDEVKKEWNIPDIWQLVAQMPFGGIVAQPDEKVFKPLDNRVMIFE